MTCFHPLRGVLITPFDYPVSKRKLVLLKRQDQSSIRSEAKRLADINSYSGEVTQEYIELPCGKCLGCRLDKSNDWATRLYLESKYYKDDEVYHVTFTYDPQNVLKTSSGLSTLPTKKEFSVFIKLLREFVYDKLGMTFRFFACGEYGDKFERPHVHCLLFGLRLPDLQFRKNSGSGYPIYSSEFLSSVWKRGIVTVQHFSYEVAAYVARYVMKKQTFNTRLAGRVPEWINMSRKPGIGRRYYDDYKNQLYQFDGVVVKQGNKAYKKILPRYYDKLYDVTDHDKCEAVKAVRRYKSETSIASKLARTSLSLDRQRIVDEEAKAAKLLQLRRSFDDGIDI